MMPAHPAIVLVVSPSDVTGERIARRLAGGSATCQVRQATTLRDARRLVERLLPAAIFLEETVLSGEEIRGVIRELAQFAPVVAAVSPESARALAVMVVAGTADCVPDGEDFLDLAAALVERRLLSARRLLERIKEGGGGEIAEFGSILRHELNNPLTGILGNAEMLLNRRQWLPQDAVPRLETIADLAVRLRETIRRLSGAWETRHRPQHIG